MIEETQLRRSKIAFREHLSGYQKRDAEIVDYQMYELQDTRLSFRGPPLSDLNSGNYFTCVGAAQTFGCFCEQPYPSLLSKRLGLPVLNLGYGGAGPEFFERHDCLDRYINAGRFLILQVMSGRSQSNSLFDCRGLEFTKRRKDGVVVSASSAYAELISGVPRFDARFGNLPPLMAKIIKRILRVLLIPRLLAVPQVRAIVRETRREWVESYQRFLSRINVPVVLFWFSKRTPHYQENLKDVYSLFGEFPHLVKSDMLTEVQKFCEGYVECVTGRGSPQPLVSRFTGAPVTVDTALDRPDLGGGELWTHNEYYPSPEMHEDGTKALLPTCETVLSSYRQAL